MNIAEQFVEHGRLILCGFQRKCPARPKAGSQSPRPASDAS
jgi:hypothetical protein